MLEKGQKWAGMGLSRPCILWPLGVFCGARHFLTSLFFKGSGHQEDTAMSIDKSLKVKAGGSANRSVLTRVERLEQLKESARWSEESDSPFGLPKVRVRNLQLKKKKKEKKAEEGDGDGDK